METNEIWKDIEGYKNYQVSSFGRVKNVRFNKIMSPHLRKGYERIGLVNDKSLQKKFAVSRLVAKAFINSFKEDREVDHIDRVKTNNHVSNLRCVTRKENLQNLKKNKIFQFTDFVKTLSKNYNLVTIDDLVSHLENNNLYTNSFIVNILKTHDQR